MSDAGERRESIRRRLLVFLIPSVLMLVIGGGIVTYWVALQTANAAYDRSLLDPVVDLSANIKSEAGIAHLDLSLQAQQALLYDQSDKLVFQIRAPDGKIVAGVDDFPPPAGSSAGTLFYDASYRGDPIRIASSRTDTGFLVQVGETLNKRNRLIREILATELVPTLLVAIVSIGLAWAGVARGLAPLERIRGELLQRSALDLRPIDDRAVPIELVPAVAAFNRLLGRLRDASELQQRFLANAAHQLRTPLAGLQMHLELLLRRQLAPDIKAEVETMHNATTRASRLARQLLALARLESATTQLQPLLALDLKAIVDAAAEEWVPRALESEIDLGFAVDSANALGDPISLREMLNNLVDNALRYTPSGGTVTVRSGQTAAGAFLSVDDSGPGIPETARNRIFERFYRIDGSPGEGSGLGLAIVKEVVDRHGATLAVETPERGRGTRIVVSFPSFRP